MQSFSLILCPWKIFRVRRKKPLGSLKIFNIQNPAARLNAKSHKEPLPLNLPPGKRPVINLLNPTRRAPALKNNQIRLFLFHNLKSPQSPRLKFLSNIPAFSVYNLPLLNFRRSPGSRKPTQNFRTNLGHLMIRQKFHQPLIKIVPTVIFTIVAHKTGTDQDFHFRSSIS